MALQQNDSEDVESKDRSSPVAGLVPNWNYSQRKPSIEWKKWRSGAIMYFAVAVTGKHSISIREVLRAVANETDRNKALLNILDHPMAKQNCVSCSLFIYGAARETH